MKFAQSEEDGTMPLLECIVSKNIKSGDLILPSDRGLFGMLMNDGMRGWPVKRPFGKNCTSQEGKNILWEESERAVGRFFTD